MQRNESLKNFWQHQHFPQKFEVNVYTTYYLNLSDGKQLLTLGLCLLFSPWDWNLAMVASGNGALSMKYFFTAGILSGRTPMYRSRLQWHSLFPTFFEQYSLDAHGTVQYSVHRSFHFIFILTKLKAHCASRSLDFNA